RLRRNPRRHRKRVCARCRFGPVRVHTQLCVPALAIHLADDARHRAAADHFLPAGRSVEPDRADAALGATMSALLETVGLTRFFGAVRAAENLSVRIDAGEMVGIIGSNGSGKTTFLNLVTGYLKPERGRIFLAGQDTTALPPRLITRLGVARSFQIPQL